MGKEPETEGGEGQGEQKQGGEAEHDDASSEGAGER